MSLSAGKLWGMRRMADAGGRFKMLAVDQRVPLEELLRARGGEPTYAAMAGIKRLLVEELGDLATSLLLDPLYAVPAALDCTPPTAGLLVTAEHGRTEDSAEGRRSRLIADWSVAKIKRLGADGVKLLLWFSPAAAPAVIRHQQALAREVGRDCRDHDIPFLLELLIYRLPGQDEAAYLADRPRLVADSAAAFADAAYGVDIFKLETPLRATDLADPAEGSPAADAARAAFAALAAPIAGRPWVMLSAAAPAEAFRRVLHYAYGAGASGYLAGRSIWLEAAELHPDMTAMRQRLRDQARRYMASLNALTDRQARPWQAAWDDGRPQLADGGPGFAAAYPASA
jgi:tagatose 1,6-diphosphate aldolase